MAATHRSDPKLIQACLAGDQRAWHTLIEQYARLVYSIPRRYGMSDADADDVFQNVFATLVRSLDRVEDQTKLSAWLITTTHRECWRHGKRSPVGVELDERDIRADSPPQDLADQWELQHQVRRGLDELGDPCKSLLEALFLSPSDMDYETIAGQLGMKVGSIGPTRARCFKKLEAILRKLGYEPATV